MHCMLWLSMRFITAGLIREYAASSSGDRYGETMPWRNCPSNATNDPSVAAEGSSPALDASGGGADGVTGGESSEGSGSKFDRGDSLNGNSPSLLAWASRY